MQEMYAKLASNPKSPRITWTIPITWQTFLSDSIATVRATAASSASLLFTTATDVLGYDAIAAM